MGLARRLNQLQPPTRLHPGVKVESFDCGEDDLNHWLKHRARRAEGDTARTYVVCDQDGVLASYYCLSTGAVERQAAATSALRRNAPDPIPVMVIGRLAVDQSWQGHGLGPLILRDALLRILQASEIVGIRAVLVHAISEQAKAFYVKYGFKESPMNSLTLMLPLAQMRKDENV
ncbi:MAG: GNAT family N-acetyltransferase [Coleofasciculaceae cyanobacterium RL_1_1]|nr:GNAT family N-acetyltransferase [Coleofasciculaceae cyanobacterium RL_1_1]